MDIQVKKRSIRGSYTITSSTRYVATKALYGFKNPEQRVLVLFSHSSTQGGQPDQLDIARKTNDRERSRSIVIFEESEQERKTMHAECCMRLFSYFLDRHDDSVMVDSSTAYRTYFTTHD